MSKVEQDIEKVADAIWAAEYLLVVAGPNFDEGARNPFNSEYCDSQLIAKPNKLMGFWGAIFNDSCDKSPHDGFTILARWRDRFFSADDVRRRQNKRRQEDEGEQEKVIARFAVFSPLVTNLLQKSGIPSDEIYEPCGNVTLWQCSAIPPCCSRVTPIDRGFRFVIDEATHEAMPIKYVSDKRDVSGTEEARITNCDDDDIQHMMKLENLTSSELRLKDEKATRVARAFCGAGVHRILYGFQPETSSDFGYCDGFADFPTNSKATFAPPRTFADAPPDEEALYVRQTHGEDGNAAAAAIAGEPCSTPRRCSHLLAHIGACSSEAFPKAVGTFFPADPKRYAADRESYYYAVTQQKIFVADAHTLATKRSKYIRYNISVAVVASKSASSFGSFTDELQLLPTSNGMESPGALYFSNVPSRQTLQEPIQNHHHDVVRVNFPADDSGAAVRLPTQSTISVVCETICADSPDPKAKVAKRSNEDSANCPFEYRNHVWQMVGQLGVADLSAVPRDADNKDIVEYVLESRERYVIHIGVRRSSPTTISYLEVEVPCNEDRPVNSIGRCAEVPTPPQPKNLVSRTATVSRPPVPTPNHILCASCHGVARPFVLMNRPGATKDEGFCQNALAAKTKAFKAWEKSAIESLKQDQNKSIVIMELGCDKKVDVSRAYAEKTFKSLKGGKCTFVRIAPMVFDAKKQAAEANFVHLEMGVVSGLTALDRAVNERMRKK